MPPHCDTLDGPVVVAARAALDSGDVTTVLPYVPAPGEHEVETAYKLAEGARAQGGPARDVADRWFFETVVRVHRAGEGMPFTGLQPAGLDPGPVIEVAERAVRDDDPEPLADLLTSIVREEVEGRFADLRTLRGGSGGDIAARRAYVTAMLGVQVWAHALATAAHATAHEDAHEDGHRHEH